MQELYEIIKEYAANKVSSETHPCYKYNMFTGEEEGFTEDYLMGIDDGMIILANRLKLIMESNCEFKI